MDRTMTNGKSSSNNKLTNGSTNDSRYHQLSMNGINDDRQHQPIDLIGDDNSDDLYNDSYMDIDNDPIIGIGSGGAHHHSIYNSMMLTNAHQQQHSSNWDDGILLNSDLSMSNGTVGGNNIVQMPTSQQQQLLQKLIHKDFFNRFDDLLDNDDLD